MSERLSERSDIPEPRLIVLDHRAKARTAAKVFEIIERLEVPHGRLGPGSGPFRYGANQYSRARFYPWSPSWFRTGQRFYLGVDVVEPRGTAGMLPGKPSCIIWLMTRPEPGIASSGAARPEKAAQLLDVIEAALRPPDDGEGAVDTDDVTFAVGHQAEPGG